MLGAAIFLQASAHHDEEEKDPTGMDEQRGTPQDNEQDEKGEDLWDMFTDEEEEEKVQANDRDEDQRVEPLEETGEREGVQEEVSSDVVDELRHRLGRKPEADENANRLEALERRVLSRKDEE